MGSEALNAHIAKAPTNLLWVWFEGATALLEGQGVCYNFDYGTATAIDGKRMNRVELPSITNSRWFAGVAARPYAASSGGQMVEINGPGSTCNILSKETNVIGAGRTTCIAGGTDAGYFRYAGFEGRGSAVALQTVDRGTTAGKCLARLEDGPESGLIEVITAVAGANTFMVGGITYFGIATLASDATFTLADGDRAGQRKAFSCLLEQTTSDIVITVTSGAQGVHNASPIVALATITLDAAGEEVILEWGGSKAAAALWYVTGATGTILA